MSNATINFAELLEFKMYEGNGPSALLPWDGMVQVKNKGITIGQSKSGNTTLKLVLEVSGEEIDGKPVQGIIYKTMAISGKQKGEKGKFNSHNLGEFLVSSGVGEDEIAQMAAEGQEVGIAELITRLTTDNNISYVRAKRVTYQGKERSDVDSFVTPKQYTDAVTGGTARNFISAPVAGGGAVAAAAAPTGTLLA